jgi:hypothetical protein
MNHRPAAGSHTREVHPPCTTERRRRTQSRRGDAASTSRPSATQARTVSRSRSTTVPSRDAAAHASSSHTPFGAPRDGNLVLFVVNDHGALRSYRVDRIAAYDQPPRRSAPSSSSSSRSQQLTWDALPTQRSDESSSTAPSITCGMTTVRSSLLSRARLRALLQSARREPAQTAESRQKKG